MVTLDVTTTRRIQAVDVTAMIEDAVTRSAVQNGACIVHVPHTTAGVIVNEHDDPDVMRDLLAHLTTLVPQSPSFRHAEGNADAHIKAALTGTSVTLIVNGGRPVLGRWQGAASVAAIASACATAGAPVRISNRMQPSA